MALTRIENEGLAYYLDETAQELAKKHNPNRIHGPHGLTGDYGGEEAALMPFLLAALNTGRYYGFDFNGYEKVVNIFKQDSGSRVHMTFAQGAVKDESKLRELAAKGHLRQEFHEGTTVFFPSERLVTKATS